jgi:hypothetical protein
MNTEESRLPLVLTALSRAPGDREAPRAHLGDRSSEGVAVALERRGIRGGEPNRREGPARRDRRVPRHSGTPDAQCGAFEFGDVRCGFGGCRAGDDREPDESAGEQQRSETGRGPVRFMGHGRFFLLVGDEQVSLSPSAR